MSRKEEIIDGYNVVEYEKTNIYIIEKMVDDQLCNELIDIINKTSVTKTDYHETNNVRSYLSNLNNLLDSNDEFYYKFSTDVNEYNKLLGNVTKKNSILTNKMNGITKETLLNIFKKVFDKMDKVSAAINKKNNRLKLNHNAGYDLRKIFGATRLHTDGIKEVYHSNIISIRDNHLKEYRMVRNATVIFALNDNYEGGVFNFTYQDVTFKLNKGSVLIFPPYWTHPHEVSELLNNTYRYTLSTWCCESL